MLIYSYYMFLQLVKHHTTTIAFIAGSQLTEHVQRENKR